MKISFDLFSIDLFAFYNSTLLNCNFQLRV